MTKTDVQQLLINAGWPPFSLRFAVAQACFECGSENFDSPVALEDNNLTGIIWLNVPWQHNATKGAQMPASDGVGHYAHFATPQDWAVDFRRILHLDFHHIGKPIEAHTVEDYVHRLKMNGYFGGPEEQYLAGVKRYLNNMT